MYKIHFKNVLIFSSSLHSTHYNNNSSKMKKKHRYITILNFRYVEQPLLPADDGGDDVESLGRPRHADKRRRGGLPAPLPLPLHERQVRVRRGEGLQLVARMRAVSLQRPERSDRGRHRRRPHALGARRRIVGGQPAARRLRVARLHSRRLNVSFFRHFV